MHYQCWLYPEVPPAVRSPWQIYEDEVAQFAAEVPNCPDRRNLMSPILARGVLPVFLELSEANQRMFVDAALTELAEFVRWRQAHRFQPWNAVEEKAQWNNVSFEERSKWRPLDVRAFLSIDGRWAELLAYPPTVPPPPKRRRLLVKTPAGKEPAKGQGQEQEKGKSKGKGEEPGKGKARKGKGEEPEKDKEPGKGKGKGKGPGKRQGQGQATGKSKCKKKEPRKGRGEGKGPGKSKASCWGWAAYGKLQATCPTCSKKVSISNMSKHRRTHETDQ